MVLRPMTAADLPRAHALTDRAALAAPPRGFGTASFAHAEGIVAERDGELVGTALRWRWGEQPRHDRPGDRVAGLPGAPSRPPADERAARRARGCTVLLHATAEGRGLYERLGFVRTGELRQHQGVAQPAPLVALPMRAGVCGLPARARLASLQALDAAARGMPRDALIADLLAASDACVVLDHDNAPRGFAMLRRFGRGHAIGPVVAPDAEGAKALIAHLPG